MRLHSTTCAAVLTLALASALGGGLACAQDQGAPAPSRADRAKARQAYLRGKAHHDSGEYKEAVAEYQAAYDLDPQPAMLFNIAQVYRLWGERDGDLELEKKALESYESYLAAAPEGRAAPEAYGHVTALRAEIKSAEESAAAQRAKEEAERKQIEERREAREERRRRREKQARERESQLRVSRRYRIAGLAAAGAGLILGGVGVAFHVQARDRDRQIESAQGSWSVKLDRAYKQGQSAETRAIFFYSLGGAAVVAGGVAYLLGWQKRPEGAHDGWLVTPQAGRRSVGLAVGGSF